MCKKGQLSIGFYTSLIIFLGVIAYITFQLFQTTPVVTDTLKMETIRIETYQLSELLINDGGHPNDWYDAVKYPSTSDIKRIGLSDTDKNVTNLVSNLKISRMMDICSNNYNDILSLLDVDNIIITIKNHATGITEKCEPSQVPSQRTSFNITRTISIDGVSSGEITIEVWK